jgi:wyosine [tRNA(Phe)-imidazoG37] synthetase (radical SAM superfamily)
MTLHNNELLKVYGPVPSRRLGKSLGINNIPPKICTYSCVYCQLGRTLYLQSERKKYYEPKIIFSDTEKQIRRAREQYEHIDYLTFVPDGEPTLDANLGVEIRLLNSLGIKIAVIENASLLWREDVRNELCEADWVSLKVDAISEEIWRRINRPHGVLKLDTVLEGMLDFADLFKGDITSETMLIHGLNDSVEEIEKIANFLESLKPNKAYIAIPTRPPAEKWVKPAAEQTINTAYQIFDRRLVHVEYLIGYEGNAFAFTGNVEQDLLSITAVHPMRKEAVAELLSKADSNWDVIIRLLREKKLIELEYGGNKFYMRKLRALNKFRYLGKN